MKSLRLLWIGALFFTNLTVAFAAELHLPVPELETLPNGLQIAWFLNDAIPVVDLGMVVKSGYRDDPAGKSGTAMFVASLLDNGAGGLSTQQIARTVEALGATRSIGSEEDSTVVGMHGLSTDAPALLEVLGKLVLQPEFPEPEFLRERGRIIDSWSRMGDTADSLGRLAFGRLITSNTIYGRGDLLSIDEFSDIKRQDLVAFHRKHFTPKNSLLYVVGRVDRAKFGESIRRIFGGWAGEAPAREWKPYVQKRITAKKGVVVVVDKPNATQASVVMGLPSPLFRVPGHHARVVANAMLGEYFNSRLNLLIRDKLGLTYSIGSGFSYSEQFAYFSIGSATRTESVGKLVQSTLGVLREFRSGGISAEETEMAKDYLIGGFPLSMSTLSAVSTRWMTGYLFGAGPDYLNEFVPKISAVQAPQVSEAAAGFLKLDQMVIVIAGNAREIQKSLAAAKIGPVRVITAKDLL